MGIPIERELLSKYNHENWSELITLPSEVNRRNEEWECFERLSQTSQASPVSTLIDPSDREFMLSRNPFEGV